MFSIAVPKSGDQFCILSASAGVYPLLELVEDKQNFALRRQDATSSQVRQRIDQPCSLEEIQDMPCASP